MNRTAAGLLDTGRLLAGPMQRVERTVRGATVRFATRSFERLASTHCDLDVLESALDHLTGQTDAPRRTVRSVDHRRGEYAADSVTLEPSFHGGSSLDASGPRPPRVAHEPAASVRPVSGHTNISPGPSQRADATDRDVRSEESASVSGSARSGRVRYPREVSEPLHIVEDRISRERVQRVEASRRDAGGLPRSQDPQRARDEPEHVARDGAVASDRRGGHPSGEHSDFDQPSIAPVPAAPVAAAPAGVLGDLVRRSRTELQAPIEPPSEIPIDSSMQHRQLVPERTGMLDGSDARSRRGVLHPIETVEMVIDEVFRREAERFGLEGDV